MFWQNVKLNGLVVYDVGAFHGLLTLLFSRNAKHVVSFEPSAKNRARLSDNVKLNGIRNVTVRDVGLGAEARAGRMVWNPASPGGAQILDADANQGEDIEVATMDEEVANGLPAPDFIKIDVEGFELPVLQGGKDTLRKHRPALFIEIHGDTMNEKKANVARVVGFLNSVGYTEIRHIESDSAITSANSEIAARGHLYCPRKS